jgi:hypothetical protein
MADSPEVLSAELRHLQKQTDQQSQALGRIENEVGKAARKADRFESRLTELEEHSRETIDGVAQLRDLVQRRNVLDDTQVAAAQLVFKWGGWFSGVLLIVLSLWSGKMQSVLEAMLKFFGQKP